MPKSSRIRWVVLFAFLVPLAFAWFTNDAWEDYYITLRSARNLIDGHGLVFNIGERVHTFTSPLGVLLPAACLAMSGTDHEELGLWLFRLVNAALLAFAARMLLHRSSSLRVGTIGKATLVGLILADPKLIDFAINGMETAILLFFAVLLWAELESPTIPRVSRIAIAIGGLMWTRPDAFILAGAIMAPHFVFKKLSDGNPHNLWPIALQGALFGGLLYVPWFAWAWHYYGSPIPHTIIAKSFYGTAPHLRDLLLIPWRVLTGDSMILELFLPAYSAAGNWPTYLRVFAYLITIVAYCAWLVPGVSAPARRLSLAVFTAIFYLSSIPLYPWYLPPWSVLSSLAFAFVADQAYATAKRLGHQWLLTAIRITCAVTVIVQVGLLGSVAWQQLWGRRLVADKIMRPMGRWLYSNAARGDAVFLESLGYIGYYSNLKTYDYPGLSSPEVVACLKAGRGTYSDVIESLRPQWVILRPLELIRPEFKANPVLRNYDLVRVWDSFTDIDAVPFLPGRNCLYAGGRFFLFHRKPNGWVEKKQD